MTAIHSKFFAVIYSGSNEFISLESLDDLFSIPFPDGIQIDVYQLRAGYKYCYTYLTSFLHEKNSFISCSKPADLVF